MNTTASSEATQAAVVRSDPRRIVIEERPIRTLGPREVLVRTHAVGICHSDLDLLDGHLDSWLSIDYPLVFGHEWSGDVLEVGHLVHTLEPGDRVTGCADLGENRWFGTTSDGAAAEQFVIPDRLLYRLPQGMTFERGALVEPFACAYQGIRVVGGADASDAVCVVGIGTIGMCALLAANALGARALAVDPSASRRAKAAEFVGADAVLDPTATDDLGETAAELLGGERPALVIEAAGASAALASALELAGENGRVLYLGLCAEPVVPAQLGLVQKRNLHLVGSTGAPPEVWPRTLSFLERSGLDLSPLISATFPLSQAAEAFDAARDTRTNLKVHLQLTR